MIRKALFLSSGCALLSLAGTAAASSHREAPFLTENPKVDGTDLYMFRSYETGRTSYTTIIADYIPVQEPAGGPNFFMFDPDALYEIHIDNNGNGQEDMTFQFRFRNEFRALSVPVGTGTAAMMVQVPVLNIGPISETSSAALNVHESYTMSLVRGPRRGSAPQQLGGGGGRTRFFKPVDNIGRKSIPDYEAYAQSFVYDFMIPGCNSTARVFVGQRDEPFFVNVGPIFDLINLSPAEVTGACQNEQRDGLAMKNVTSIALELPTSCLTQGNEPIIGAWTTSSLRQARVINPNATYELPAREGGAWTQVSRVGQPLVNEVVIGLGDKDRFNGSHPSGDAAFLRYVTHPTLPVIVNILFGGMGAMRLDPNSTVSGEFPRTDLVAIFLTGIMGVNQPANVVPSEMLRLNTGTPPVPVDMQNPLGVLAGDLAGYPNGRRPLDDVTDISLRAAMGAAIGVANAATRTVPALDYTDCARGRPSDYLDRFPYANTPFPGASRQP